MVNYSDYRVSPFILAVAIISAALVVFLCWCYGEFLLGSLAIVALAFLTLSFFAVEVVLTQDSLVLRYGVGLIQREFPYTAIQAFTLVGVNLASWIYDPKKTAVLQLQLRNGRLVTIPVGDGTRMRAIILGQTRG